MVVWNANFPHISSDDKVYTSEIENAWKAIESSGLVAPRGLMFWNLSLDPDDIEDPRNMASRFNEILHVRFKSSKEIHSWIYEKAEFLFTKNGTFEQFAPMCLLQQKLQLICDICFVMKKKLSNTIYV